MSAITGFDLKMDMKEKIKTHELLDQESRITMSTKDFQELTKTLNEAFTPNAPLQKAINVAQRVRRA